jgi:hypothetical protein
MVATRARKRRAQLDAWLEDDDDDQQEEDADPFEQAALALKEADAARAKKNKQRRIETLGFLHRDLRVPSSFIRDAARSSH